MNHHYFCKILYFQKITTFYPDFGYNKDAIIFLKAPFFLSKGTATVKPAAARIDGLKIRQALLAGTEPN